MTRPTRAWLCSLPLLLVGCAAAPPPPPPPGAGPIYHVVAVGDSYASGQGSPNEPIDWWKLRFEPSWDNRQCNRSKYAGANQAVDILRADPAFAGQTFELRSFACSGASIEKGVLTPFPGPQPPHPGDLLPAQVDDVKTLAQQRTIDALIMTIGGNDILFEYIVAACMLGTGHCDIVSPILEAKLQALGGHLTDLANALAPANIPPDHIFLVQYPDPTTGSSGDYCDHQPGCDPLGRISGCEAQWMSACIVPALNYQLCSIASQRGWHYVEGMAGFHGHGWCASDNWVNTIDAALRAQGHYRGGLHPNPDGYAYIGGAMAAAVKDQLLGTWSPPTSCQMPPLPAFCSAPCGVPPGAPFNVPP